MGVRQGFSLVPHWVNGSCWSDLMVSSFIIFSESLSLLYILNWIPLISEVSGEAQPVSFTLKYLMRGYYMPASGLGSGQSIFGGCMNETRNE